MAENLYLLTDQNIIVLKQMAEYYRNVVFGKSIPNSPGLGLHRASDIVRVNVTEYISVHTGSGDPTTVDVTVWDVFEDQSAGYTVPITKSRYYPTVVGKHYAAIDRHGIWRILLAENAMLIQTPSSGISGKTSTSPPFGFGSALCRVVDPSTETLVSPAQYITVKNVVDQDIAGNAVGKAEMVGGVWILDLASCSPSEA